MHPRNLQKLPIIINQNTNNMLKGGSLSFSYLPGDEQLIHVDNNKCIITK